VWDKINDSGYIPTTTLVIANRDEAREAVLCNPLIP
jgi:hypothetical protein